MAAVVLAVAAFAAAQQVTGTPGSPAATTTIDGKHTLSFDFKYDGLGADTLEVDRPEPSAEDIKNLANLETTAVDGQPIHHMRGGPHWPAKQRSSSSPGCKDSMRES
jgi:hypothetical protein